MDDVLPWRAERCIARWEDGPRGAKALARWQSTVREAAKQARRPWCPPVAAPVSTAALLDRVGSAAAALVLHESARQRLPEVKLPVEGELLLVVGPEGGISDAELAALTAGRGGRRSGWVLRCCARRRRVRWRWVRSALSPIGGSKRKFCRYVRDS